MKNSLLSIALIRKLILSFLAILVVAGIAYTISSVYLSEKYYAETTQRLHANLAQDLIDEKFSDESPFQVDGEINKALFGDIMHDMMAVNRAIEVYLLNTEGVVQYSVVLDHEAPETKNRKVNLEPVNTFIENKGQGYYLGQDPKDPTKKQVFSAARFQKENMEGYIYILLAGKDFLNTRELLLGSYMMKMGLGNLILTLLFTSLMAILSVWYLTKNLRELVHATRRFQQGDLEYRIKDAEKSDLASVTTTFNEMADTILADMNKLQSVESLRRELIANISHDLRTPLAIIQGYIETLQMKGKELSQEQRDHYLNTIENGSKRLGKLITQLFEYSKLEANQIEPKKEPFLISELANDIYSNYAILAQKKNIQLDLNMDDNLPLVFADISLVERAIQNLMDNALKFTPNHGKISIGILKKNEHVEIHIKDSGPGIQEENQSLIFERYRQTKSGKKNEGAGLGLAIVRKIVELHNSKINIDSIPNEGAKFTFTLPVHGFNPAINL
ncbi:sensor histidine kinase [Maribacter sp. 4G9]|uniref:sensor histidine kinase n=1 Tax=Maribacter sp. 4G9 TaxID=1889777 RepID=UPI000C1479B1|nr:HAMP domain-containing sensor histidine kinase [Maribacter sp. 4G9]PIB30378.1 two-component sensor histidine kinase [Maribacter sp. 4G9]